MYALILVVWVVLFGIYYFITRRFLHNGLKNLQHSKLIAIISLAIILFVVVAIGFMLAFPTKHF
jgi:hypothetical protein